MGHQVKDSISIKQNFNVKFAMSYVEHVKEEITYAHHVRVSS